MEKNQIKIHTAEKELYAQGQVIVRYSIEYPEIIGNNTFNHNHRKLALHLKKFVEGEFYNQAKENYEYDQITQTPIKIYYFIRECHMISYGQNSIKLYFDEYTFIQGKKGMKIQKYYNKFDLINIKWYNEVWDIRETKKERKETNGRN